MCEWSSLVNDKNVSAEDAGAQRYKEIRKELMKKLAKAVAEMDKRQKATEASEQAGAIVLKNTIQELMARIDGNYDERSYKYYYIDFLRANYVLPVSYTHLDVYKRQAENTVDSKIKQLCKDYDLPEGFFKRDGYDGLNFFPPEYTPLLIELLKNKADNPALPRAKKHTKVMAEDLSLIHIWKTLCRQNRKNGTYMISKAEKQERPFRQARMFRMDIACTVLVSG